MIINYEGVYDDEEEDEDEEEFLDDDCLPEIDYDE